MVGNFERLRYRDDDDLKIALNIISEMTPCNSRDNTIKKIKEILDERDKKLGVLIKSDCGEEHHVKPTQKVSEILVDGKQIYPIDSKSFFVEPKCKDDVRRMIEFLHGGKWRFSTNTEKSTYKELEDWVRTTPENTVIVPWAFYGSRISCRGVYPTKDDIRLKSHNACWERR